MLRQYSAIQPVPSACSSTRPSARGSERSNGPTLSMPRKPPPNRWSPSGSLTFAHQVNPSSSLWNIRSSQTRSRAPSSSNTDSAASACTGGLTSEKFHSYAGSWPLGCMYHSRVISRSCSLANSGSTCASVTQWKARSQAAYQGYSHLSGIEMTSRLKMCPQRALRPCSRLGGGTGCVGSPCSQRLTS